MCIFLCTFFFCFEFYYFSLNQYIFLFFYIKQIMLNMLNEKVFIFFKQLLTLLIRPNVWHKCLIILANIIGSSWFAECISSMRVKNCLELLEFENEYFSATIDSQVNIYKKEIVYYLFTNININYCIVISINYSYIFNFRILIIFEAMTYNRHTSN